MIARPTLAAILDQARAQWRPLRQGRGPRCGEARRRSRDHGPPTRCLRLVGTRCYPCPVDPKPRPNHQLYLEALRRLTPGQRLLKAFELTELSRELFRAGLKLCCPEADEAELERIYLERLSACHSRPS